MEAMVTEILLGAEGHVGGAASGYVLKFVESAHDMLGHQDKNCAIRISFRNSFHQGAIVAKILSRISWEEH